MAQSFGDGGGGGGKGCWSASEAAAHQKAKT